MQYLVTLLSTCSKAMRYNIYQLFQADGLSYKQMYFFIVYLKKYFHDKTIIFG